MSRGFDAFVGNPPWVSFVGRAAQPLDERDRAYFERTFESFAGYKNLQGVFVERALTLLRRRGRIGMIVPSSMSELDGYAPTRAAHDRRAACDDLLKDLGTDEFRGVFQPCMALLSTRRPDDVVSDGRVAWPMERTDLDDSMRALLARLTSLPPLPSELFGERGLQTCGDDVVNLVPVPDASRNIGLRTGSDIGAFHRRAPSLYARASDFGRRLRAPRAWERVRVLIRQTARVPIAALSDGGAFRNSILAGFANPTFPATFLVAYLNSTPVRWLHFARHRDARQGLPQVKIGHLRAIPAPIRPTMIRELSRFGLRLSRANLGIDGDAQRELDGLASTALGLDARELARIATWVPRFR